MCFWADRKKKKDGRPGLRLAETFSTSLKMLNEFQQNLSGSNILTSSTKFVIFGPIGKTRWPSGLNLAETFSTSPLKLQNGIQQNLTGSKISTSSTKFVFFLADLKYKMAAWCLMGWEIVELLWNRGTEFNETLQEANLNVPYQVYVFPVDRKNEMAFLASDWLWHFRLLWNCWMEFNKTWLEARSQRLLPSLCFSGRSQNQDGCHSRWLAETFSAFPL